MAKTNTSSDANAHAVNADHANGGSTPHAATPEAELTKQLEELQAKYQSECDAHAETMESAESLSKQVTALKAENETLKKRLADADPSAGLPIEPGARVKLCNLKKKGKKMMVGDGSGAVVTFDANGIIEVSAKEAARLLDNKDYKKVE
jgi:hypothetical protein